MNEIRIAAVGMGHRGRAMFLAASKVAEKIIPVAACDLNSDLWYKSQRNEQPMAEKMPDTKFYDDFYKMLDNEKIDALLVETPAHNHAAFCAEALYFHGDLIVFFQHGHVSCLRASCMRSSVVFISFIRFMLSTASRVRAVPVPWQA